MTHYRKGWKYNFELILHDDSNVYTQKKVSLSDGFRWASKVISYIPIGHEDDTVIRITKVRVIYKMEPKIITLKGRDKQ